MIVMCNGWQGLKLGSSVTGSAGGADGLLDPDNDDDDVDIANGIGDDEDDENLDSDDDWRCW